MLRCVECGTESDTAWRWVAYVLEDPEDEVDPEVALYCPDCAEREFGPFGPSWSDRPGRRDRGSY